MGCAGEPFGRFALDHEPGVLRWRIGLDKPPDDGGGPIERNIPHDLVGDSGQPKTQEVGRDDRDAVVAQKARAKCLGQRSVELNRDDPAASKRQFSSEDATARPDLDHQIVRKVGPSGRLSDQAIAASDLLRRKCCERSARLGVRGAWTRRTTTIDVKSGRTGPTLPGMLAFTRKINPNLRYWWETIGVSVQDFLSVPAEYWVGA